MSLGPIGASLAELDLARDAYDDATALWRCALRVAIEKGCSQDAIIAHTGLDLDEIRRELTYFHVGDPETPRLPPGVEEWLAS